MSGNSYSYFDMVKPFWRPCVGGAQSGRTNGLLWYKDLGAHVNGEFSMAVVQANSLLEDQSQIESGPLDSVNSGPFGTFVGVYDGHGGPESSRFVNENLFSNLKKFVSEDEEMSADAIKKAFLATEDQFISIVRDQWRTCPQFACVGTCCLVGVICDGVIYIANAGDSRVVLGRANNDGDGVSAIQLSEEHNVNRGCVRDELRSLHPDDPKIVVMKHNVWRVKGLIQVSRSIGDAYLKNPEFNRAPLLPKFRVSQSFSKQILSPEPSISTHKVDPNDEFLIFASDGLWEQLSNEEAVDIVHTYPRNGIARRLVKAALNAAAKKREVRYLDLKKIERGVRRHFHDDITVVVVFLDRSSTTNPNCSVSMKGGVGTFIGVYDGYGVLESSRFVNENLFSNMKSTLLILNIEAFKTMKLASIIQNGIHHPLNLDLGVGLLRFTPVSPSTRVPRWVHLQITHSPNRSFSLGVCRNRWPRKLSIVRSKGVEQEEGFVSPEKETSSSKSFDENTKSKGHLIIDDVLEEKTKDVENYKTSVKTVALCVFSAVTFGVGLGLKDGVGKASEFFAGYLLEQSLSVDNLFVFVLIFKYFKVPLPYQNRVLSYGIGGAIIFRLSLILLGTATLQRFEAVNLLLASILLYSSFKLFFTGEDGDEDLSENFIVKTCQKIIPLNMMGIGIKHFGQATPLLLTVAVIELSDIAFAVDSIPAVFGVTRDPFIVFSSNLFAILGLRSLYTLISESMSELEYLQPAIGIVLGFIGGKMILDFFGYHVSTEVSLGCVATTLSAGVLLSILKKSA
ncbi:hypothetical protein LXL04_032713 [Taraxacum kok-saghyz]